MIDRKSPRQHHTNLLHVSNATMSASRSSAGKKETSSHNQDETRPIPKSISTVHQQPPVVNFLRNFLHQSGMTTTLDCFETEWTDVAQKGPADASGVGAVPEVYTENLRLESNLKHAREENEEYRQAACAIAETLLRVQKERDHHRMQHLRVLQEKHRLIQEMKRLKLRRDSYETTLKRMTEKHLAVLQKNLAAVEEEADVTLQDHQIT
nr:sperm-associated antigen 16 protein-like [Nothobranchius furzeri]